LDGISFSRLVMDLYSLLTHYKRSPGIVSVTEIRPNCD
jgi:hypothetical protein